MNIWKILGIDATTDKAAITKAYRARLSSANPEDHPEAFKELRSAYEKALDLAKQAAAAEQVGGSPADQWIAQVNQVYQDIQRRQDVEEWHRLLAEEYPSLPVNRIQARDRLLEYLTHHSFLPHAVWQVLDEFFHLQDAATELLETFPPPFVQNMVLAGIHHQEQIPYEPLECEAGADCDLFLRDLTHCFQALAARQTQQAEKCLEEAVATGVRHPYTHLAKARLALLEQETELAQQEVETLLEQLPQDLQGRLLAAQLQVQKKDYAGAETTLRAILAEHPHLAQAKYDLAECLVQRGKLLDAKALYLELLRTLPFNRLVMNSLQQLNQALLPQLEEKRERSPEDAHNLLELAWCHHQLHQEDKANELLYLLPKESSGSLDFENLASKVKLAKGEWDAALSHLRSWDEALRLEDPLDEMHLSQCRRMQSYALYYLGQKEEAFSLLEKTAEQWPQYSECWKLKGQFLLQEHDLEGALESGNLYREKEPDDPGGPFLCGEVLFRMNRLQDAYNAFNASMEVAGGRDAGCMIYQCRILMIVGQWKDAQEILDQLVAAKITSPEMEFCLAQMANHNHQEELAIHHYKALLPICRSKYPPDFAPEVFFRLVCLEYEDRSKQALLELVEEGLRLAPQNLGLLELKVDLLRDCDEMERAIAASRQLCQLAPHHPSAFETLGRLLQFCCLDFAEAAKAYETQLQNRETPVVHNLLGLCLKELGRYPEAESQFGKALELSPETPSYLANLAELYLLEKEYSKAEQTYRAVLELPLPSVWDRVELRHRLSLVLRRTGKWEEAAKVLLPNIQKEYHYDDCRLTAKLWVQAGQPEQAMKALKQWQRLALPQEAEYLLAKAEVLQLMGKEKQALKALKVGARSSRSCCTALADLYLHMGKYPAALKLYQRLSQDRPSEDDLLDRISKCLLWSGDSKGAKDVAQKGLAALEVNRSRYDQALYYTRKAAFLISAGELEEAAAILERAEKCPYCSFCTYSGCKDALVLRALLLEEMGQLEKALEIFRTGKVQYPDELDFAAYEKRILRKLEARS